jgi:hypothetical protein
MKIGDRIEVKLTGEHGTLIDVLKYFQPARCVVRLDSGEEIEVNRIEIRGLQNRQKKHAQLMKKVTKGGGPQSEHDEIEQHDPEVCGCRYLGNDMWSCGHIDNEGSM